MGVPPECVRLASLFISSFATFIPTRSCSRWSAIIRAEARFWRSIDFRWNQITIERYLSFSQDSPLSLVLAISDMPLLQHKNLLLSNMGRAGDIKIINFDEEPDDCPHTKPSYVIETLPQSRASSINWPETKTGEDKLKSKRCPAELLVAAAPHLSNLLVICRHDTSWTHSLPPLQHLSRLTSVELRCCHLGNNWDRMFPASLRYLRTAYTGVPIYDDRKPGIDMVDIIRLMAHCPDLISLDIAEASINPAPTAFALREKGAVRALQLRRLNVPGMSASEWDLLLHHIEAPSLSESNQPGPSFRDNVPPVSPVFPAPCEILSHI